MDDLERRALARIAEILIPGAGEAGIPGFVEREVGALEPIRAGVAGLVASGFLELDTDRQVAGVAAAEGSVFFETLRLWAIRGLGSDPRYGGNVDGLGWALLRYPGPKQVWSAEEQQIRRIEDPVGRSMQ